MTEPKTVNSKGGWLILLSSVAINFLLVFFIINDVLKQTGGMFSYPVDDVYIHLEVAKNLAFHHTWGVNPGEFGSASSSLFYTGLLALLFKLIGNTVYPPLIINCLAGLALLVAIWKWLQNQEIKPFYQFIVLMAVVFFMPLPILIISGMEHVLQTLFSFLFLFSFAGWLQKLQLHEANWKLPWPIFLYAILTASIRYEGLFLIAAACLFLLFYKRVALAMKLGFVAALPLILFGIYSLSKGSYPLPNSVLIKSEAAQFSAGGMISAVGTILTERLTFSKAGVTLLATQRLLFILPLCFLIFTKPLRQHAGYRFLLIALSIASLLQLTLADTGKFYRYEAYLVACSIVVITMLLFQFGREYLIERYRKLHWLTAFVAFLLFFPLFLRSAAAFSKAGRACINIYEQQYQMGRFLKTHYNNSAVAANDIGAVSYFTDANILDLWGLANIELARSRKGGYWNPVFVDSVSRQRNVKLALVYDSWVGKVLPPHWKKVATWQIFNNVVCGDDFVSFYAADATDVESLKSNLKSFESSLPPTVKAAYY